MTPGLFAVAAAAVVLVAVMLPSPRRRAAASAIASAVSPAPAAPASRNLLRDYHDQLAEQATAAAFEQLQADQVVAATPAAAERIRATLYPKAGPPPAS